MWQAQWYATMVRTQRHKLHHTQKHIHTEQLVPTPRGGYNALLSGAEHMEPVDEQASVEVDGDREDGSHAKKVADYAEGPICKAAKPTS